MMHWKIFSRPILIIPIILVVIKFSIGETLTEKTELPCDFLESINITEGVRGINHTILYNGNVFPYEKYATINYVFRNGSAREMVEPHIRGCLCTIKTCVRLCCPYGDVFDYNLRNCTPDTVTEMFIDVIDNNNGNYQTNLTDLFAIVDGAPCDSFYYPTKSFKLSRSGQIYDNDYYKWYSHQGYCLAASHDKKTQKIDFSVFTCITDENQREYAVMATCKLISLSLVIATMLVYICLPELRNLHGKCLISHLAGLTLGYILHAAIHFMVGESVDLTICKLLGYMMYFSFTSAFLWLSVISFDVWWNFRSVKNSGRLSFDKSPFVYYAIYAWGLSTFMTVITFVMDSTESLADKFQPGIGKEKCFLKSGVSEFLYYYTPIAIIIMMNLIFFLLTALKIRQIQRELDKITAHGDSSSNQNIFKNKKNSFALFLRLFFVMGVGWIIEPIWAVAQDNMFVFYLNEICHIIIPLLIFLLFVIKRNVLLLIKKKFLICAGRPIDDVSGTVDVSSALSQTFNNVQLRGVNLTSKDGDSKEYKQS